MALSTYKHLLYLSKPINTHLGVKASRFSQEILMTPMLRAFNVSPYFKSYKQKDYKIILAKKEQYSKSDTAILYLHGGAYLSGETRYVEGVSGVLADRLDAHVYGVVYRLAPEFPFPNALNDVFDAYQKLLLLGYKRIALIGESAGGGLIFALCSLIKERGLPPANAVVAFSPWTDLTFSGKSFFFNNHRDPSISKKYLKKAASHYIRNDSPNNPHISPIFCNAESFPKALIYTGSLEVLLSDSVNMNNTLKHYNVSSKLIIGEGMWHAYPLFLSSPDEKIYSDIKDFVSHD